MKKRGILVMAYGKTTYIDEAKGFSASLMLHSPNLPRALVTDSNDQSLNKYFDYIIAYDKKYGSPYQQKLYVDHYSPFEKTIFFDVDCLVVRDIHWIFDFLEDHHIGIVGNMVTSGSWYNVEITDILEKLRFNSMIKHNGGMLYFDRSEKSKSFFSDARDYFGQLDELGFSTFRSGGFPDEPAVALAATSNGIEPVSDGTRSMRHTAGIDAKANIDVIQGKAIFRKHGIWVYPSVVHFGRKGAWHLYKREKLKARLSVDSLLWPGVIRIVGSIYGFIMYFLAGPRVWLRKSSKR